MKTTKLLKSTALLVTGIALVFLNSCSNDDESGTVDTTPPSIQVTEPTIGEYLAAGEHMHFIANFMDDVELGVYNINIHDNFDGHSHGRIAGKADDPSLIKWSINETFQIPEGRKSYDAHLDDEIEIPANAMAGPYDFIVSAIDKAGNATSFQDGSTVEFQIIITNDSQPVVEITNLENDELEIEVGEAFMVEGTITDPLPVAGEYAGIHSVEILLGEDDDHSGHNDGRIASTYFIDLDLEEEELEEYMEGGIIILEKIFEEINFILTQEQLDELHEEEIDHLELIITVRDEQGNITISKTPVHIHED